jgi:hypothetical protein
LTVVAGRVAGFSLSSSVTATVGDEVSMTCKTDLDRSVNWVFYNSGSGVADFIYAGGNLLNGYAKSHKMETKINGEYRLIIPKVELKHAGRYECMENEGLGPGRASLTVTVLRKPVSVSISSPTVEAGRKAVLKCVTGFDNPSVDWYFYNSRGMYPVSSGGRILNEFKKMFSLNATNDGEFSLILMTAAVSNSGEYECIEGNGLGPGREKVKLSVELRISKPQTVRVGDYAILSCATGQEGAVTWRFKPSGKSGQDFIVIKDGVRFKQILAPAAGEHRLVISNAQSDVAGLYECADDSGSGKRATVEFRVTTQEGMDEEKEKKAGEDVWLDCPVESLAEAEWTYCPSADVPTPCCVLYSRGSSNRGCNNRVENATHNGKQQLILRNISIEDAGRYYCINDEGFGERVATIKLNVLNAGMPLFVILRLLAHVS